ncbi:MAG TPA: hypothetical protein VFV41_27990 [Streptosporangiaceae bacterium]|nr:hypothetical protein [Streptosporangiaceae bacterium]
MARYLVAAGQEEDTDRAYQYAVAARELAARVGIVRETCAIAAYQAGKWSDALAEFRAARRLTGRSSYLPLMADCERGLGRLDRALEIVTGPEARAADRATQLELRIVESGIRRDQGLPEAAVVALQVPELTSRRSGAGQARLSYAYADALLEAGREEEAREWFTRAAAADRSGETDAADRVEELDDVLFEDLEDGDSEDPDRDDADLEDVDPEDSGQDDDDPDAEDPQDAGLPDDDLVDEDLDEAELARMDLGAADHARGGPAPDSEPGEHEQHDATEEPDEG